MISPSCLNSIREYRISIFILNLTVLVHVVVCSSALVEVVLFI